MFPSKLGLLNESLIKDFPFLLYGFLQLVRLLLHRPHVVVLAQHVQVQRLVLLRQDVKFALKLVELPQNVFL